MKKKIIAIVLAVLCVGGAAGLLIAHHMRNRPGDIRNTPLPVHLDAADLGSPTDYSHVTFRTALATHSEQESVPLFGDRYYGIIDQSDEKFTDEASGIVYPEEKRIRYYDAEELLFICVNHRYVSDIYGANGTLVYSCDNSAVPETQFDAEPLRRFYKDGALAALELYFMDKDSGNVGTAYYNGDGDLLCLFTEIFATGEDGTTPTNTRTYYNAAFETCTQDEFDALLPDVDAPQFYYINWS